MIPQIIPHTSGTPRLRQPVSRSPVARRHANALSTKAGQIPMALTARRQTFCPYTRSSHASVSYETSSKSHASRLQDERFVRDFLQKSRFEAAKQAFRTRLSPKAMRQVSKTSISYETSSKKSHVKSPKRAFRARLPQKLTRQSLQNEHFVRDFLQKSSGNTHWSTHITQPCQAVSRFQPLQTTPAHTPILM